MGKKGKKKKWEVKLRKIKYSFIYIRSLKSPKSTVIYWHLELER